METTNIEYILGKATHEFDILCYKIKPTIPSRNRLLIAQKGPMETFKHQGLVKLLVILHYLIVRFYC